MVGSTDPWIIVLFQDDHVATRGAGSEVPPSEAPFEGVSRVKERKGGGYEGLKVEAGFTFGRL